MTSSSSSRLPRPASLLEVTAAPVMSDCDTVCSTDSEDDSYRRSSLTLESSEDDGNEGPEFPVLTKMEMSGLRRKLRGIGTGTSTGSSSNMPIPFEHTIRGRTVHGLRNFTLDLDEQGALDTARAIKRLGRAVFLLDVNFYCRFAFRGAPRPTGSPFLITDCHSVTSLDLSHTTVGNAGAELIASLLPALDNISSLRLHSCDIRNDGMKALAEALFDVVFDTSIEKVELSWNSIGASAADALCRYLRVGGNLWEIDLEGLFTTEDIAMKILRALRDNGRLGVIELCRMCQFWEFGDGASMGRLVAEVIENNPFLSYLGLDGMLTLDNLEPIVDEVCTVRPGKPSMLKGLQFLDISGVFWSRHLDKNADSRFTEMISRLVRNNETLDGMAMRGCKLETNPLFVEDLNCLDSKVVHPVVSLANALRMNQTLTFLDLRSNEVGAAGINALRDMLISNRHIESISIGGQSNPHYPASTYYDSVACSFRPRPYGQLVAPSAAIDHMQEILEWNRQEKVLEKVFSSRGVSPFFLSDSFPDEMLPNELSKITGCSGTEENNANDEDTLSKIYCMVRRKHPALMASLGDDIDASTNRGKNKRRSRSSSTGTDRRSHPPARRSKRLRGSSK